MITAVQVKTKSLRRRVHFQKDNSLEKEEERSRRGQLNRKIVKNIKKEWAKTSSNPVKKKYTDKEKQEKMRHAFACLTQYEDSLLKCFECQSIDDFLGIVDDSPDDKVDEDSLNIFQTYLISVVRAAGGPESESMKNKLAWLKQEITSKRLVYESFMEREGAKPSLWILCRNNCFQSIFPYNSAVSTSEDEGEKGKSHGLEPALTKNIIRNKFKNDDVHKVSNSFLTIADPQSSETQRVDRKAECLEHLKRQVETAGAAAGENNRKRKGKEVAADGERAEEAESEIIDGKKPRAKKEARIGNTE